MVNSNEITGMQHWNPTVLRMCLSEEAGHFLLPCTLTGDHIEMHTHASGFSETTRFPHNVISFRIFWLDISQTEIIKDVKLLRRGGLNMDIFWSCCK